MQLSDDAKNVMLQGLADRLNAGKNSMLLIYVGTTISVEIALNNPVELSITGGVLMFDAPPKVMAFSSGTPTEARILDASGTLMATLPASLITFDKDKIRQGDYVGIRSIRFSI